MNKYEYETTGEDTDTTSNDVMEVTTPDEDDIRLAKVNVEALAEYREEK